MDIGTTKEVTVIEPMVVPQRTRPMKVPIPIDPKRIRTPERAPVRVPEREPELVPAIPKRREEW